MVTAVSLHDLVDALESQSDSMSCFLDRETGEVYRISEEALLFAEDEPDTVDKLPDWQEEEVALAKAVCASDRYLALPTSWDVHQWRIMREFCWSLSDKRLRVEFLMAIDGRGSFRRFKAELTRHGLWDSWREYQRQALSHLVIEWCQQHAVPFVS
jgi:hypothetical protein